MHWRKKPYKAPEPERWFAWYPVTLTAHDISCWLESLWRLEVSIDSEKHYLYSDSKEGLEPGAIARKILKDWGTTK